jgi:hypothetical protein
MSCAHNKSIRSHLLYGVAVGSAGLGKDATEKRAQCDRLREYCRWLSCLQRTEQPFSGLPNNIKQINYFNCSISHPRPSYSMRYQLPTSDHYQPLCQFPPILYVMPLKSSWATSFFSTAACRETTKSPVLSAISPAQAFPTLTSITRCG